MNEAGYDALPMKMDLSDREDILNLIAEGQKYGDVHMLVNAAGVSPSQAPVETILKVDLYGTAVLLEEVGKGHCCRRRGGDNFQPVRQTYAAADGTGGRPFWPVRMPKICWTGPMSQPENVNDTLHAYQLAKRCNEKRVMAEAVRWGEGCDN